MKSMWPIQMTSSTNLFFILISREKAVLYNQKRPCSSVLSNSITQWKLMLHAISKFQVGNFVTSLETWDWLLEYSLYENCKWVYSFILYIWAVWCIYYNFILCYLSTQTFIFLVIFGDFISWGLMLLLRILLTFFIF